jgi:glucosamine-phosphate N-acetyltransferase
MNTPTSHLQIDDDLVIRLLEASDYHKGFFEVLSQLTSAQKPSECAFISRLSEMSKRSCETVYVVEHLPSHKIIGTISILIELKFIHNLSKVCHVEDFVIDVHYRNRHVGSTLLQMAIQYARDEQCYKLILDCADELMCFYEKFGFKKKANSMQLYF